MESVDVIANPSEPVRRRRALHVVGIVVSGIVRLGIVGAALAVPAYVLWQQREVLAHSFLPKSAPSVPVEVGAATVLLGRPSGEAPRPRPIVEPPRGSPAQLHDESTAEEDDSANVDVREAAFPVADPTLVPGDFEVVVAKGLTLGEISATYYGTSKPRHVQALAAYNGLSDANKLRLGQKLRVPHISKLGLD
jgi:nucleoid-associated protein YgaU